AILGGCVASIVKSKECLVFRHNYPAKETVKVFRS
ncbi:hypothetical protein BMETH_3329148253783, partial [methanotrophic bacterial endosymbiont of Bathymodiolus sp.]